MKHPRPAGGYDTLKALTCNQPDRDEPRMKCGYPLPCPWHSAVIDVSSAQTSVTIPIEPVADAGRWVPIPGMEANAAMMGALYGHLFLYGGLSLNRGLVRRS